MMASVPALTVAIGFIVNNIPSDAAAQGPVGSSVVNVKVTLPEVISLTVGVYVALSNVALLNVPIPEVVHVEDVALPPRIPESVKVLPAQMVASIPAFVVARPL